jgi:hypothetical protein
MGSAWVMGESKPELAECMPMAGANGGLSGAGLVPFAADVLVIGGRGSKFGSTGGRSWAWRGLFLREVQALWATTATNTTPPAIAKPI